MRRKALHIHQTVAVVLLLVFAIALTPFSAFHHHDPEPTCVSSSHTKCSHKSHLQNHGDTCLICAVHFEKNYITEEQHLSFFSTEKLLIRRLSAISGSYTRLIGCSLRGPPAV